MSDNQEDEEKSGVETDHGNVRSLHGSVEKFHKRRLHISGPSYPPELKDLTFEILRAYKEKLRLTLGRKNLGWQAIRDVVVSAVCDHDGNDDSAVLTRFDFEDWDRRAVAPKNSKFKFIDKFVKLMELSGEFDEIRHEINRVRHRHRRLYFERAFRSSYAFREWNRDKYTKIRSEIADTYWLSREVTANYYKQFLFYIGHLEEYAFDAMAVYFPYALDLDAPDWSLQNAFAAGGIMTIDTLKGVRPETGSRKSSPYGFGDSFTVLLFRDENRGGEDAAFTSAELVLDSKKFFRIRWPRTIVAPSLRDYTIHAGLYDGDVWRYLSGQERPPEPQGPTHRHPLADLQHSSIYIGDLDQIKDTKYLRKIRSIFDKFEI
ncbi:MAG: hypothetical protein KC777_25580 [Cyanobacteria bacterium HKST-UBA02]|nr:hypothetical protein [Cyanobacteria bacterium HKST-UBA02]